MKDALRGLVRAVRYRRMLAEKLPTNTSPVVANTHTSILVPAAAPGGLGDDAMMNGAINSINIVRPNDKVSALVPKDFPSEYTFNRQLNYEKNFSTWGLAYQEAEALLSYSHAYFLGADIMDGAYCYPDAVKRIRMSKYCYSQGVDSRIIGFSLNENPHPAVIREFQSRGDLPIFLRDPLSYERAQKILGGDVRLSADVAFLLKPENSSYVKSIHEFADGFKSKGKAVFGLNIHELLGKFSGADTLEQLIVSLAKYINEHDDCAFVLIPHDYRSFVDDRNPLRKIVQLLNDKSKERVYFAEKEISASEIKGICGVLDGVITGRMHLAIAALGMGIPVLAMVYQGKFEGTLSFFNIDEKFLMNPAQVANYSYFTEIMESWIKRLPALREEVECSLERVQGLSKSNFE